MSFLQKIWDETLAGPAPDSGLGRLRKYNSFSASRSPPMLSGDVISIPRSIDIPSPTLSHSLSQSQSQSRSFPDPASPISSPSPSTRNYFPLRSDSWFHSIYCILFFNWIGSCVVLLFVQHLRRRVVTMSRDLRREDRLIFLAAGRWKELNQQLLLFMIGNYFNLAFLLLFCLPNYSFMFFFGNYVGL